MPSPWIERKFSFQNLTEADFPSLVDRLRATPAQIQERLTELARGR